jgi:A/G-specific adenine glycosylase
MTWDKPVSPADAVLVRTPVWFRSMNRAPLLRWYEPRRGAYPWRVRPEPYLVLVSEFMLQQTQATRVLPAYRRFLKRFPSVAALARASRAEVIREWQGLGYNRRAVSLSEAARAIVRNHRSRVPSDPEELRRLPGVGPYTAAAVAALAYGKAVPAVDTNVRRIVARALLGTESHEASPVRIKKAAEDWLDPRDPAGWNQALMDLGREVCRPTPRCSACPLENHCVFRGRGRSTSAPPRRQKPFPGSFRQVRGQVIDSLRHGPSTLEALSRATGAPISRVAQAVAALDAEGMVRATPGALKGRGRGRASLRE